MSAHRKKRTFHGMSNRPLYRTTYTSWREMRTRCSNPNRHGFHNYGGRGIKICERWDSFANFVTDMGLRPFGKTLDRINNDGNYEPTNCRWATPSVQLDNTRRVKILEHKGERMSMHAWARKLGIAHSTLRQRVQKWPLARALSAAKP
jgi:hypothetical protein